MGKHDLSDLVQDRGQAWLERPDYLQSLIVQRCTNPRNVYLSFTKGDLRLPSRGMSGFVLGINSQLVEIDSNRRLSRTVRNLASSNIVVTILWIMMVMMNMELYTSYDYYCYATKCYTTCLAQVSC